MAAGRRKNEYDSDVPIRSRIVLHNGVWNVVLAMDSALCRDNITSAKRRWRRQLSFDDTTVGA